MIGPGLAIKVSGHAPALPAFRRAVGFLLVVPFLMLSLIAQGTMVTSGPTPQSFMMVLCGAHEPVAMVIDDQGNVIPAAEQDQDGGPVPKKSKSPCDWSSHAQPLLVGVGTMPVERADAGSLDLAPLPEQRLLRAEILTPSARGPPTA
ncbi:hypothetical protein RGQ15_20875 [Paracoccus sp. MBLB3053]|uniref:DUF2946 domain-containing protein n=1 Tax=Paracoccus aurantius TaxID=3073814 RepID=A0ABU2HY73_9RHOB|nr:hypothetical protein [Paracoccus sp. MBLB3053]MDS9470008.1 hypothetical protein [Paracoccus sp. MBLB3053]